VDVDEVEEGVPDARVGPVEEDVPAADARDVSQMQVAVEESIGHRSLREPLAELDEPRLEPAEPRDLLLVEPLQRLVVGEELPDLAGEPTRAAVDAAQFEQRGDLRGRGDLHEREHAEHRLALLDGTAPAERLPEVVEENHRRELSTASGIGTSCGKRRASPSVTRPSSTKSGRAAGALKYTRPPSVGTRRTADSDPLRTCSTGPRRAPERAQRRLDPACGIRVPPFPRPRPRFAGTAARGSRPGSGSSSALSSSHAAPGGGSQAESSCSSA
jgi:hypothetical protein